MGIFNYVLDSSCCEYNLAIISNVEGGGEDPGLPDNSDHPDNPGSPFINVETVTLSSEYGYNEEHFFKVLEKDLNTVTNNQYNIAFEKHEHYFLMSYNNQDTITIRFDFTYCDNPLTNYYWFSGYTRGNSDRFICRHDSFLFNETITINPCVEYFELGQGYSSLTHSKKYTLTANITENNSLVESIPIDLSPYLTSYTKTNDFMNYILGYINTYFYANIHKSHAYFRTYDQYVSTHKIYFSDSDLVIQLFHLPTTPVYQFHIFLTSEYHRGRLIDFTGYTFYFSLEEDPDTLVDIHTDGIMTIYDYLIAARRVINPYVDNYTGVHSANQLLIYHAPFGCDVYSHGSIADKKLNYKFSGSIIDSGLLQGLCVYDSNGNSVYSTNRRENVHVKYPKEYTLNLGYINLCKLKKELQSIFKQSLKSSLILPSTVFELRENNNSLKIVNENAMIEVTLQENSMLTHAGRYVGGRIYGQLYDLVYLYLPSNNLIEITNDNRKVIITANNKEYSFYLSRGFHKVCNIIDYFNDDNPLGLKFYKTNNSFKCIASEDLTITNVNWLLNDITSITDNNLFVNYALPNCNYRYYPLYIDHNSASILLGVKIDNKLRLYTCYRNPEEYFYHKKFDTVYFDSYKEFYKYLASLNYYDINDMFSAVSQYFSSKYTTIIDEATLQSQLRYPMINLYFLNVLYQDFILIECQQKYPFVFANVFNCIDHYEHLGSTYSMQKYVTAVSKLSGTTEYILGHFFANTIANSEVSRHLTFNTFDMYNIPNESLLVQREIVIEEPPATGGVYSENISNYYFSSYKVPMSFDNYDYSQRIYNSFDEENSYAICTKSTKVYDNLLSIRIPDRNFMRMISDNTYKDTMTVNLNSIKKYTKLNDYIYKIYCEGSLEISRALADFLFIQNKHRIVNSSTKVKLTQDAYFYVYRVEKDLNSDFNFRRVASDIYRFSEIPCGLYTVTELYNAIGLAMCTHGYKNDAYRCHWFLRDLDYDNAIKYFFYWNNDTNYEDRMGHVVNDSSCLNKNNMFICDRLSVPKGEYISDKRFEVKEQLKIEPNLFISP